MLAPILAAFWGRRSTPAGIAPLKMLEIMMEKVY
jgi:hypothetical protein